MTLDFLTFIKEEIKKIPAKPRGRAVGSGKAKSKSEPDVRLLVTMLSGLAPNESPKELANRLSNLVEDEVKMEKAVTILEEKEKECGRKEGYIQLRIRKTGKIKAKK